jgi:hypothetical protein
MNCIRWFIYSAVVLLSVSASAKLISSGGTAKILARPDALLPLTNQQLLWLVGGIELAVVFFCIASKRNWLSAIIISWLATCFWLYRLGLLWVGYTKACSCLGTMTDSIGISPDTADTIAKCIAGYLLLGSYGCVFWTLRQKHTSLLPKVPVTSP